jgi:hypothetical protein
VIKRSKRRNRVKEMYSGLTDNPRKAKHKYGKKEKSNGYFSSDIVSRWGYAVSWQVEALCYKPEGRGFDSR